VEKTENCEESNSGLGGETPRKRMPKLAYLAKGTDDPTQAGGRKRGVESYSLEKKKNKGIGIQCSQPKLWNGTPPSEAVNRERMKETSCRAKRVGPSTSRKSIVPAEGILSIRGRTKGKFGKSGRPYKTKEGRGETTELSNQMPECFSGTKKTHDDRFQVRKDSGVWGEKGGAD